MGQLAEKVALPYRDAKGKGTIEVRHVTGTSQVGW
jgi:hypothetical protein